jgi:hypothetical protein
MSIHIRFRTVMNFILNHKMSYGYMMKLLSFMQFHSIIIPTIVKYFIERNFVCF